MGGPASQAQPEKQVILLVADYLTVTDLQSFDNSFIQQAVPSLAVGLMNTSTAGSSRTSPHTQVTISAGRPAVGGSGPVIALEALELADGELASTVFQRYTGLTPKDDQILILNWPQIMRANRSDTSSKPVPGLLGDKIENAGLTVAVFGNSDTPKGGHHRPAVVIAGNGEGLVPSGLVGKEILKPSGGLLPWRTDYDRLFSLTLESLTTTNFIVVDFGDLYRLETVASHALEQVAEKERATIIKDIDRFYRKLLAAVDLNRTLVILASTTPSPAQLQQKNYLVPIMMAGGNLQGGLLYSNTTRRPGLITNTDLTASILSHLGIKPTPSITGQPINWVPFQRGEPLLFLEKMNERMVFTYQIRSPVIRPYIGLQILTLLLSVPLFFSFKKLIPYFQWWLGLLVAYPAALLLVGVFANLTFSAYVILSVLLALLLTKISYRVPNQFGFRPFVLLSMITSVLITVDLVNGSFFMKQSVLGYDPIAGARYYGIGNEYMGVLIGSSFMGLGVWFKQKDSPFFSLVAVLYFGLLIWLMFAADFGANLGGTVSLLVAVSYWLWRWHKTFIKEQWHFIVPLTLFFLLIVIGAGISLNEGNPSHIGRTVQLVRQEGPGALIDIILRKVQMNLKLIRYTPWSRVFLLALLAIGILFYRPTGFLRNLYGHFRPVYDAFLAVLTGSLTALVWNDSGIVAAATTMIYGVYPLISRALTDTFLSNNS